MTTANFDVPTAGGTVTLMITTGHSVVIVGANGSGKTRLGVLLEKTLGAGHEVHRVAAHRSLVMNTDVQPGNYEAAERILFYGNNQGAHQHRTGHRWQNNPATILLNDFDHVLRALYADENRSSIRHRQEHLRNPAAKPPETKLDLLTKIWRSLLPYRELIVLDANIQVSLGTTATGRYNASDLSDGERVIFYLLGQCLLVRTGCIIIIDEPELHIHRAILTKLWDAIETARQDCAFVYLTHDLEFSTSRHAAQKFALRDYVASPEQWEIQLVPDDTNIPEDVVSKILGSRESILFVEGDASSLDASLYRRVFPEYTVIPVGSCEEVIHAVASFKQHASLHRLGCAGLIDADDRSPEEITKLQANGVFALPVSEAENLLLMPDCLKALAAILKFNQNETETRIKAVEKAVLSCAGADLDRFSREYTKRRIDRSLKVLGLNAKDIASLDAEFRAGIAKIDPVRIFNEVHSRINALVTQADYPGVLALYDNKGLLSEAARIFGLKNRNEAEELIARVLRDDFGKQLMAALSAVLPQVTCSVA